MQKLSVTNTMKKFLTILMIATLLPFAAEAKKHKHREGGEYRYVGAMVVAEANANTYKKAKEKVVNLFQQGIDNSAWSQPEKANAAGLAQYIASQPVDLSGNVDGDAGRGSISGTYHHGGFTYCWTRVLFYLRDPIYHITFTAEVCGHPTPTATPRPTAGC